MNNINFRIGNGIDAHAFIGKRPLILGGILIPFDKGLEGHSDADVLIHAIIDALLGAAALDDIGTHFPDSDPQYKGISSVILLRRVSNLLTEKGFHISNIDATIIAEKPKIRPYVLPIRTNLANVLVLPLDCISLKATTTEKMGFTGREEGIAAIATVMVYR